MSANPLRDKDLAPLKLVEEAENRPLRDCVSLALQNYFDHLDGHGASDVYQMVLTEVEQPLLQVVLNYTGGNQTRAAEILGLNRGTLRKKLRQYGIE